MFDVQTHLATVIENARPDIPASAYSSLTKIAKELSAILSRAGTVQLTVEYEYMLESMAQNDIPDSIRYYLEFPKSDPTSNKEMEALFLEQLDTIRVSIAAIQQEMRNVMTNNMKSHSQFIKEKFSSAIIEDTPQNEEDATPFFEQANQRATASLDPKFVEEKLTESMNIFKTEQKPVPKNSFFKKMFLGGNK